MKGINVRIAYALDFVSLVFDRNPDIIGKVKAIILFGSTARGDFGKESDIDIFVEIFSANDEKDITNVFGKSLGFFSRTQRYEMWRLKGAEFEISIKVGVLEEWELKSSIYADGIVFYGKYKPSKEKLNGYFIFRCKVTEKETKSKVSLWRKLYGYTYRKGGKEYRYEGLLSELKGRKLGKGVFIVPNENAHRMIRELHDLGVDFRVNSVWSEEPLTK